MERTIEWYGDWIHLNLMFLFGGMCEIIYTLHFKSFLHIELVFYVNLTNVSYTGTTSSYYRILQYNQSNLKFKFFF